MFVRVEKYLLASTLFKFSLSREILLKVSSINRAVSRRNHAFSFRRRGAPCERSFTTASDQFIVRFTGRVNRAPRRCSRSIYPNLRGVFRTGDKVRGKKKKQKCRGASGTESEKKMRPRAHVYRVQSRRLSAASRSRIYDALITMQFSMDHGGDGGWPRGALHATVIASDASCKFRREKRLHALLSRCPQRDFKREIDES